MSTPRVTIEQLRTLQPGSRRDHDRLVEAVRLRLALERMPCLVIYTGPVPYPDRKRPGSWLVRSNPHQEGCFDILTAAADQEHPLGRGVFLDMKTGGARLSSTQLAVRRSFESRGFLALVVRRLEDLESLIVADRRFRKGAA